MDPRHSSPYISNLQSTPLLNFLETRPIHLGRDAFQMPCKHQKVHTFQPFNLPESALRKVQIDQA